MLFPLSAMESSCELFSKNRRQVVLGKLGFGSAMPGKDQLFAEAVRIRLLSQPPHISNHTESRGEERNSDKSPSHQLTRNFVSHRFLCGSIAHSALTMWSAPAAPDAAVIPCARIMHPLYN
jgi:hypothetical protein